MTALLEILIAVKVFIFGVIVVGGWAWFLIGMPLHTWYRRRVLLADLARIVGEE